MRNRPPYAPCLFCGEPRTPDHGCDGRQGAVEALESVEPVTVFGASDFDGDTYDPELDQDRLSKQLGRVYDVMRDGQWRTLDEIATLTAAPPASVSARLRDLRKPRFGQYAIDRQRRGEASRGLFEYRLLRHEQVKGAA